MLVWVGSGRFWNIFQLLNLNLPLQERLFQAWSCKQEENIKNVLGQRDCTQICKSLIPHFRLNPRNNGAPFRISLSAASHLLLTVQYLKRILPCVSRGVSEEDSAWLKCAICESDRCLVNVIHEDFLTEKARFSAHFFFQTFGKPPWQELKYSRFWKKVNQNPYTRSTKMTELII